jgi:hypothetical protein
MPEKNKAIDLSTVILNQMCESWSSYGGVMEPFTEKAAIEIAINELLDAADSLGLMVSVTGYANDVQGVVIHNREWKK